MAAVAAAGKQSSGAGAELWGWRRQTVVGSVAEFTAGKGAVECSKFEASAAWFISSQNAALCEGPYGMETMVAQIAGLCFRAPANQGFPS